MKCPICLGKFFDVGDGYECRVCGYFLEYDEWDAYDEEEYSEEEYAEDEYDEEEYDEDEYNEGIRKEYYEGYE